MVCLGRGSRNLDELRSPARIALNQLSPEVRQAVGATHADGSSIVGGAFVRALAQEIDRTAQVQDIEAARQYLLRPESAEYWDIAKSKSMQSDLIAWGKGRPDRQEMALVLVRVFSGLKLAASRSAEEGRSLFRHSLCSMVNCEIASRPAAIEATPR